MLSWWAPITIVLLEVPGMVAIMEDWPHLWGKTRTKGVGVSEEEDEREEVFVELVMVSLTRLKSQAEDSAP